MPPRHSNGFPASPASYENPPDCTKKVEVARGEWATSKGGWGLQSRVLCASSELVRKAEIGAATRIDVRDETVLGVVAQMLALFRLGQVDDRAGDLEVLEHVDRGVEIDLIVRIVVDVETRSQPTHDLSAAIVRRTQQDGTALVEDRGVELRLRAA